MTQTSLSGSAQPTEISIEATILRCTCGKPDDHRGQVCPQAKVIPLGIVSYRHRNPLINAWRNFKLRIGVK
jgi:hypothetical protein